MAVKNKVEVIPESTRTVTVAYICDLCGDESPTKWEDGNWDTLDINVSMKTGESYPESGSGETIEYDVCPSCFKSKIIPFMESHGAKTRREEWDY